MRNAKDAPRKLHISTMLLNEKFKGSIKGKRILLWDDVVTWGNTSEGARNLLLLAGTHHLLMRQANTLMSYRLQVSTSYLTGFHVSHLSLTSTGAERVDIVSGFSTGSVIRTYKYEFSNW